MNNYRLHLKVGLICGQNHFFSKKGALELINTRLRL